MVYANRDPQDTFRWKGENVSTAEVSKCLGRHPGVVDANVYGVQLPNHDGRAGCAALMLHPDVAETFDLDGLLRYVFTFVVDRPWINTTSGMRGKISQLTQCLYSFASYLLAH